MKPTNTLTCLFLAMFLLSCTQTRENQSVSLDCNWQFRKAGDSEWLSAKVPGCVHTDLLDHKKIPDPFFRKNEQRSRSLIKVQIL